MTATEIKERPILFSTPMVKAILEGRKTVTRRVINPQPELGRPWKNWIIDPDEMDLPGAFSPYGITGDVLWVRETWTDEINGKENHYPFYLADFPMVWNDDGEEHRLEASDMKWKPSIFMRKHLCRVKLDVLSVRVERLHDITEEDAIKEGVKNQKIVYMPHPLKPKSKPKWNTLIQDCTYREGFESLWKSINGEASWNANPWVWRIEFKKI